MSDEIGCAQAGRKNRLLNAVNSSGAVSPAIRASAQHDAGDDTRQRRRHDDAEHGARARRAERQRAFAHRPRDEQQQFLRSSAR